MARQAAHLIRRLDPWRHDPRVACVTDICETLEGPSLFKIDTLVAIEALADDLCGRLAAAVASGAKPGGAEDIGHLHAALVDTVAAARKLEEIE